MFANDNHVRRLSLNKQIFDWSLHYFHRVGWNKLLISSHRLWFLPLRSTKEYLGSAQEYLGRRIKSNFFFFFRERRGTKQAMTGRFGNPKNRYLIFCRAQQKEQKYWCLWNVDSAALMNKTGTPMQYTAEKQIVLGVNWSWPFRFNLLHALYYPSSDCSNVARG